MALRIRKTWSQIGSPQAAGTHRVDGIGKIVITKEDMERAAESGGEAVLVLENRDDGALVPVWQVVEIGAA
jgi:hypothetical protein